MELNYTNHTITDTDGLKITLDGIVNPIKIDNRNICAPPDNQGNKPHCSGYAVANYIEALHWKLTGKLINIDAVQIFNEGKALYPNNASGLQIRYAINAALKLSNIAAADVVIPFVYKNDDIVEQIKHSIHKNDFILAQFTITDSWVNLGKDDQYIIQPSNNIIGEHAVLLCGYDSTGVYIQNSWSKNWGFKGFAILPWELVIKQIRFFCYINSTPVLVHNTEV